MEKVVVLKKTREKFFIEKEIFIKELELKVLCVYVPFKRKLKRKDKEKLFKIINNSESAFTSESELSEYERGVVNKTWLDYFPLEGLSFIMKNNKEEKIAIECDKDCALLKETVLCLGERYRFVELCSDNKESMSDFVNSVYSSIGLPVNVKTHDAVKNDRYIIRIDENISVYDFENNIEYTDVEIEYIYPLSRYQELPLEKILKSGLKKHLYTDIIQKGMVKIRGEISK